MINPQWLELPISRIDFHGPKDVRAIEVRLYMCLTQSILGNNFSRRRFKRVFFSFTKIGDSPWETIYMKCKILFCCKNKKISFISRLSILGNNFSRRRFKRFFFSFTKIGDSPWETTCIKCQILFCCKNKKISFICRLLTVHLIV